VVTLAFLAPVLHGTCANGATEYEVEDTFSYAMNCHRSKCRAATDSSHKPMGGIGSLVDAPSKMPDHHIFVGSKAPWEEISEELPQFVRYAN